MNTEITVALISLAGSLIGTISGIMVSSKLTAYRIEQLEKKVEKHNTIVERTYALEKKAEVFEERVKVINHRIEDLEHENVH